MEEKFTCCICGQEFDGWGNNPYPIVEDEDARCCDDCNSSVVVPARIKERVESIFDKKEKGGDSCSKQDVEDKATELIKLFQDFVNAPSSDEERSKRDAICYPMVMGVNLLANMLVYNMTWGAAYKNLLRFYNGEEFHDRETGQAMREKHRDAD